MHVELYFFFYTCIGATERKEIILNAGIGENQKVVNVDGNSSYVIIVQNVLPSVSAMLFQAHSHIYNMTISESEEASVHNSITGRNIGLVYRLHTWESEAHMWLMNKMQKKLSVFIIISDLDSYGK